MNKLSKYTGANMLHNHSMRITGDQSKKYKINHRGTLRSQYNLYNIDDIIEFEPTYPTASREDNVYVKVLKVCKVKEEDDYGYSLWEIHYVVIAKIPQTSEEIQKAINFDNSEVFFEYNNRINSLIFTFNWIKKNASIDNRKKSSFKGISHNKHCLTRLKIESEKHNVIVNFDKIDNFLVKIKKINPNYPSDWREIMDICDTAINYLSSLIINTNNNCIDTNIML